MKHLAFIRNPYFFLILAVVLYFPAFLINLGDQPIIEDESIRSLVAFEMFKSGDYITPTIGCDPYLRKPPLYNWLIAASYALFGNYSETTLRMPMVLSLFFFGLTIFLVLRREFGARMGVINALVFITVGRILFFESLHGLIDIAFSWLTYLMFMLVYFLFRKRKYLALFILAYGITSITWLMKGAPAAVFLGITLLVVFISNRKFKMLFNWRHFAGILVFLSVVGGYYFAYFVINEVSPEKVFSTLIEQTTRRTVVRFGWLVTLKHILTFPFEMFYHFLPWTVFSVVLFKKGAFRQILSHPFLKYNLLLLLFQIIPYWTSPEVHPRYILMLVPLYFTLVTHVYFTMSKTRSVRILEGVIGGLLVLSWIAPFGAFFHHMTSDIDHLIPYTISFSAILITVTWFYWKERTMRIFWFALAMIFIRIGFDLIILPTRQKETQEVPAKESAQRIAELTRGETLYCYWNPGFEPDFYYHRNILYFRYHFYLASARDELLCNTSVKIPGVLYLAQEHHIRGQQYIEVGEFTQELEEIAPLKLIYFTSENETRP